MMELCDRRGFVASLAALGVAGTARPARGDEAPPLKISPIREGGVGEVLKVAHFEIAAGAAKLFRILHASDTHLNFWDVTDFYGNEARERHFGTRWVRFPQALTSLLATIGYARERGLPLFHTGDLIDWNTSGNASVCRRTLDGVDLFYALGNHEYHTSGGKAPALSEEAARERVATFIPNDLTAAFAARKRLGKPSKPTADEDAAFRKMAAEYLEKDPAAFKAVRLGLDKK